MESTYTDESTGQKKFSPTILLVDDDDDQLLIFDAFLKGKGHNVVTARSATEALHILKDVHIDLVICDMNMPEMTGGEFVQQIRYLKGFAHLPIISFTAVEEFAEEDIRKLGFNLFCRKQDARRLLFGQIEQLLKEQPLSHSLLMQIKDRFA